MNKSLKSKAIFSSIAAIVICLSLIAGVTFAYFTDTSQVNIAVTTGTVKVLATVDPDSVQTKQLNEEYASGIDHMYGGTPVLADGSVSLGNVVCGDGIKFNIKVQNQSTIKIKYRTVVAFSSDDGLFAHLTVTIDGNVFNGVTATSSWTELEPGLPERTVEVSIELPADASNLAQGKTCVISYRVEAVQGNFETTDVVTG
ncbi:MAG: TasA family protein [Candidatus Neoclostridium sp.]